MELETEAATSEKQQLALDKKNILKEIADLEVGFRTDKREGMIKINEAEFEKIKDIRKLTEEMDFKVKET